jgi:hypothetical protein
VIREMSDFHVGVAIIAQDTAEGKNGLKTENSSIDSIHLCYWNPNPAFSVPYTGKRKHYCVRTEIGESLRRKTDEDF